MVKDLKLRAKVKLYLVVANIVLATILATMLVYWLAFARPGQLEKATALGQYRAYSMDSLPFITGEVEADYIGRQQAVADTSEEMDIIDEELAAIDMPPPDLPQSRPDSLLEKTEQALSHSEQVLTDKNAVKQKKTIKEKRNYHGKPKISLIVTNLGLSRRSTELALTLPTECALGFLPYTQSLKPLLHKAQSKGHEIYLYLPLQSDKSFGDPGKYALMNNLAPEENAVRLNIILNSHARYDGLYSSYKEVFTENPQSSELIFDHLDDKNLIFILGKGGAERLQSHIKAYDNVIPTNIIIDAEPEKEMIKKQLQELIRVAETEGIALGYAQGFTLTIEMIRDWVKTLSKRGIQLVPVSELLKEYNL